MTDKVIIFDSGTLISFTSAGLLPELEALKKIFKGKFIITRDVKREVIDKPLKVKRFELSALKLQHLLTSKVLELPDSAGVKDEEIDLETSKILDIANEMFYEKSRAIKIIDSGEASCLALSKILNQKKVKNVIAVDERTTRMLGEKPENVGRLLQKRLHTKITSESKNFKFFKEFRFIRSAELVYVAYKKGIVRFKHPQVLDALLWGVKFKGAAISGDEIREIKRIG